MTRIETTATVSEDGASAHIDLPIPVTPGRHPVIVIIDDTDASHNAEKWAARTYGALTDATFKRPPALRLEDRETFE